MIIRRFDLGDVPRLAELWTAVFGDSTEFAKEFLENVVHPGRGFVCDADGTIAAAAYIIDGIVSDGKSLPYIYAVSTLPEFRGCGFGKAVTKACAELIVEEGGLACLHPAEDSLFDWYEKMGFTPAVSVYEGNVRTLDSAIEISPLSPTDYTEKRRSLLKGTSFADFDPKLLSWWQRNWKAEFYGFETGCMAVLRINENDIFVPELISLNNGLSALSGLKAKDICVRTPAVEGFEHFGKIKDFISVYENKDIPVYWGFAFD